MKSWQLWFPFSHLCSHWVINWRSLPFLVPLVFLPVVCRLSCCTFGLYQELVLTPLKDSALSWSWWSPGLGQPCLSCTLIQRLVPYAKLCMNLDETGFSVRPVSNITVAKHHNSISQANRLYFHFLSRNKITTVWRKTLYRTTAEFCTPLSQMVINFL